MCFTEMDSLLAYVINLMTSLGLFYETKDPQYKVISLFFLFVGQMQMFDYIFWRNQECSKINLITTKLAIIFNHLQPIVLFGLVKYYGFELSEISILVMVLYVLVGIPYNINALKNVDCTLPHNNIINWKWNKLENAELYYGIFLFCFSFTALNFEDYKSKFMFTIINFVSYAVATKRPILNYSVGRIWCYYASLFPILFYLIEKS